MTAIFAEPPILVIHGCRHLMEKKGLKISGFLGITISFATELDLMKRTLPVWQTPLLERIFHIRTSSILIASTKHYFLFLKLFSFFLVATCVSLFIGKQTIDNLFLTLNGNPNGLNFFITTMREISKLRCFTFSPSL